MPARNTSTDLATRIQQLLEERQQHADAIAQIDQVLEGVGAALGAISPGRRRGRRPAAAAAATRSTGNGRKRRRRGQFSTTGEESILSFVKQHKNPTSREIEEHWKGEGRGGPAANALSRLVKDKKLKRTPLGEGQRGSRYSLA